jgi:hypothetical protein
VLTPLFRLFACHAVLFFCLSGTCIRHDITGLFYFPALRLQLQTMIRPDNIRKRLLSNSLHGLLPDSLVAPDYGVYSIDSIACFIRALFGEKTERGTALLPFLPQSLPHSVVLLILDGLGYMHLNRLLEEFPNMFLNRLIDQGKMLPLTSVFPSTTVTALTSFSTGVTPQEHGMLGYRLYLKETASVTNMINLSPLGNGLRDSALQAGIDEKSFITPKTIFEQLKTVGVEPHVVMKKAITGSGLSRLLYNSSATMHPVVNLSDMLVVTRHIINYNHNKKFISLYWADTDAIAHVHGPWTDAFTAEILSVDSTLAHELSGRLEDTVLLITADHGFVPMDDSDYIDITQYPEIYNNLVIPPVGDTRAAYLFVRDGKKREVSSMISQTFSEEIICLDAQQALDEGLFGIGEALSESRDRIGDLVIASLGRKSLYYPYKDSKKLKGMHGSLTPDEMLVPLIISNP